MQGLVRNSLRNDCSANGASWAPDGPEYDSCATTEGFGDFVGAASRYDPGIGGTVPQLEGFDYETATAVNTTCASNRGIPLQVARAFWDLTDVTNEPGVTSTIADEHQVWETDAVYAWTLFPNGTANRQDQESDVHGVNTRDYRADTESWFGITNMLRTLVQHNCLQSQDDG